MMLLCGGETSTRWTIYCRSSCWESSKALPNSCPRLDLRPRSSRFWSVSRRFSRTVHRRSVRESDLMPSTRLTRFIVIALLLGVASGYVGYTFFRESSAGFAEAASLLPVAFLRLIKMIIAPLVFSTLVVGSRRWATSRPSGGSAARRWAGSSSHRSSRSRSA